MKASKPITALGFNGMNNLPEMPGKLLDDERRITPSFILNAEVTDGGVLIQRQGHAKKITLPGAHSLWSGSVMLVVAAGVLYRVEGVTATAIDTVTGPDARMTYAEIDNKVFMSTPYWQGILYLDDMTVRSWGVALPPAPEVSIVSGDMPPGTYILAYTLAAYGRIGGNGGLTQVTFDGAPQGIKLNNLPSGAQTWVTHPNGKELFLANVVGGVVTGQVPQAIPLPSFTVAPPLGFTDFCQAFGRIWGCAGKKLSYSDPFQYEWFRVKNYVPFLEDLIMVAPVTTGLYASSFTSTWYLDGTEPGKMVMKRVGDGAVPGMMVMAEMPVNMAGGAVLSTIFATSSKIPTPVWMSPTGVVVGTHGGNLTHLTEHRLRIVSRTQGASLYRVREGRPQIIFSISGVPVAAEDTEIGLIRENGQLFTS
ncbi:MAG: hypothetical protein WC356_02305 [Candidatus Micrarchaeia archaeon]|jgi:hypothetical protein